MHHIFLNSLLLCSTAIATLTIPRCEDTTQAAFANPPTEYRPFFRYWVPDATASPDVIDRDVELIKNAGAGGFELLGFYNYGGTQADPAFSVTDWTTYGWGTEAWRNTTRAAFQASNNHGLQMDFALGPNQGSGVPAEPDADGLMLDLAPYNISIPIGGSYSGVLPGWGSGKFVAATTALVLEQRPATLSATPGFQGPYYYNGTRSVLASDTLQYVSNMVGADGTVNISFPANESGLEYRLFAFYQKPSNYREQVSPEKIVQIAQSPVTSFIQNGSWVNDHFSIEGAQLIIDFWETYLLDDDLRRLVQEVGRNAWEDSMEFGTGVAVWWTPKMLQAFRSVNGYDFAKYLPLLYSHASETPGPLPSPDVFYLDDTDKGQAYLDDYFNTLTELNRLYLTTLQAWASNTLQSEYSAQVVYNLPMQMAANIPAVGVPECESLGFGHSVDAYKGFSGPANLADRNIISNELGAVVLEAYTQTLPELIWDVKRSIIGGVNQMIYHGYPYSGFYPNTSWPRYTTFYYQFSAMHGPRQPAWEYYGDYMNWTARMQYVAQSGVPRMDVAIYVHDVVTYDIPKYNHSDLDTAGYTYEYVSPSNFDLDNAYVRDGILAPDRQAFKAFAIRQNDTMTLSGVQKITQWAAEGLPIVFIGGLPNSTAGHAAAQDLPRIREVLHDLLSSSNVYVVSEDNLAESLRSDVELSPKVDIEADGTWLSYWRDDDEASRTYVILYNDAAGLMPEEGQTSGEATFAIEGAPYVYDAWTGQITPMHVCSQTDEGITIPLSLAGNQSVIIAFHHDEVPDCYLAQLPEGALETLECDEAGELQLAVAGESLILANWSLVVESWTPPNATASEEPYEAEKSNTTFTVPQLKPWSEISDTLRNVSGRGFYSTSFDWPPAGGQADGAEIDLGYILHTARVWVNGHRLPPLDPVKPVTDISGYLKAGSNDVVVVVATTLGAAVRGYWSHIATNGVPASLTAPPPDEQAYGLVAPVHVVPYSITRVPRKSV